MALTFRDRAVVVDQTLVMADLHLGRARTSAVEAPVGDGADVVDRVERLLAARELSTVVLAGDVLHAFDTVPHGVADTLSALRAVTADAGVDPVAVRGNHDTMLDSLWDGETVDTHWIDPETVVVHGHERPDETADRYLFGHDHPTIEIEGQRRPCWLHGPGGPGNAEIVLLPAFNRFPAGVTINEMRGPDFQSPLVVDADALSPVVWDSSAGEPLRFPPLGEFRHRL